MIGAGLLWLAALTDTGSNIPAWVLASGAARATMDLDFVNDLAWNASALTTVPTMLACSRASSGYYTKADGTLINFSSNTLRYGTSGLLDEGSRTNLLLRSQNIDVSDWTKSAVTVVADNANAPDGTLTADKILDTVATSDHFLRQTIVATTGLFSFYLKAAEISKVIILTIGSSVLGRGFDLIAGTTSAVVSNTSPTAGNYGIESLANGWYRCWIHADAVTSCRIYLMKDFISAIFLGNGTDGLLAWGGQFEAASAGTEPTSYIPTTTVSVARAADAITFSDVSWFNGSADSVYAEWIAKNVNNASVWAFDATSDTLISEQTGMSARLADATAANTVASGVTVKVAGRMALNDFAISMQGGTTAVDISEAVAGALIASRLGANLAGSNHLNGYIRRVAAFKNAALDNSALQTLSSP